MRMKHILFLLACFYIALDADAENFQPTLLHIDAPQDFDYLFNGSVAEIPVTITGTPASVIFCLFTKNLAAEIPNTINGYLGWHQVNQVDTCIYYSQAHDFDIGEHVITWDGRDQDGNWVNFGYYTYYLWGYDNKSEKTRVGFCLNADWGFDMTTNVLEVDENGLPLSNPIWYTADSRWILGRDPLDDSLMEFTSITLPEGWDYRGDPFIHPDEPEYEYLNVANKEERKAALMKIKYVPDGDAHIVEDWGEEQPFSYIYSTVAGGSPGVASDREYLYTVDENHSASNDADAEFYIYDMDGYLVTEIDISSWWSSPDDFAKDAQMNGGPNAIFSRNGKVFLGCHCSCLTQMVNPARYLASGEYNDLFVWSNGNGDYVFDHNYEEWADRRWVCNDYNVGPYMYNISADDNLFVARCAYDIGIMSFGLAAPDGTGLGYFSFFGDTAGQKNGLTVIDSETSFDGFYMDNATDLPNKPASYIYNRENDNWSGIHFIAQDSFKGLISCHADCFCTRPPYVLIERPATGDVLKKGEKALIRIYRCSTPPITVEVTVDGGATWQVLGDMNDWNSPNFIWEVPDIDSGDCYVKASRTEPPYVTETVGPFSIGNASVAVETALPTEFALSQNHPNPFNPVTTIPFSLAEDSEITLVVYNIAGEKVATLAEGQFSAGSHSVDWNAGEFASGIYFCRLNAGKFEQTRKMTVVK